MAHILHDDFLGFFRKVSQLIDHISGSEQNLHFIMFLCHLIEKLDDICEVHIPTQYVDPINTMNSKQFVPVNDDIPVSLN